MTVAVLYYIGFGLVAGVWLGLVLAKHQAAKRERLLKELLRCQLLPLVVGYINQHALVLFHELQTWLCQQVSYTSVAGVTYYHSEHEILIVAHAMLEDMLAQGLLRQAYLGRLRVYINPAKDLTMEEFVTKHEAATKWLRDYAKNMRAALEKAMDQTMDQTQATGLDVVAAAELLEAAADDFEGTPEEVLFVDYLRDYARNMREAHSRAERDEDGKASLFTSVGLAEAQGLDLVGLAGALESVANEYAGDHPTR